MGEIIALCQPLFFLGRSIPFGPEKLKVKLKKKQKGRCYHYAKALLNSKQQSKRNDNHKKPLNLNFSSTIDTPLYETPEGSFDQFLEDEKRVITALFPDIEDSQLTKKEWRIQMPTMKFLFLSVCFIMYIKLRYKSMGKDYPPHVPPHIPKIIELELTRWEVGGIPDAYQPHDLSLSFKGTIYPDIKQGTKSKLRSKFDINLCLIVSPLLGWVPHSVIHGLTESLVKTVMVDLASNARFLEDYDEFKKEKLKNARRL